MLTLARPLSSPRRPSATPGGTVAFGFVGRPWRTMTMSLPLTLLLFLVLPGAAGADQSPVDLGMAATFAVLAGAGITNTGTSTVTGDVGTYPTAAITGGGSLTVNGTNHDNDTVAQGAQASLLTAYSTAAGESLATPVVADLGGQTLSPGVYNSASSLGLTGTLILDGGGDPNATFVFQAGSTLTTSSASQVDLVDGAQSCNVFWQVGSSATLGSDSRFGGTIMALTSVTITTGASIDGRVLAVNGAVTLDTDTITMPTCSSSPTTTNPAPAIGGPQGGKNSGATKGASQTLPVGAMKASDNANTVPTSGTTNPTPSTTGPDLGGRSGNDPPTPRRTICPAAGRSHRLRSHLASRRRWTVACLRCFGPRRSPGASTPAPDGLIRRTAPAATAPAELRID